MNFGDDCLLHFLVGFGLYVFLRLFGIQKQEAFLIVLTIAIGKELVDSLIVFNPLEHLKDIGFTMIYPLILGFV